MPRATSNKSAGTRSPAGPAEGDLFPDFDLPNHRGGRLTLRDLRGHLAVIYFYPEADTPLCTNQACGLRDRWKAITALGAKVVAISPDEPAALAAFAKGQRLPFILAGDVPPAPGDDPPFMTSIGVWADKTSYGNRIRGVVRTTFILDANGRVVHRWPNVRTPTHAERVVTALEALHASREHTPPTSRKRLRAAT